MFNKYCLDSNFFIQAWNEYYPPDFCKNYWDVIDMLSKRGIIYSPVEVKEELESKSDELAEWVKDKNYLFKSTTVEITEALVEIFNKNKQHKYLIDNRKKRNLADPWVIAHAYFHGSTVVTKEAYGLGAKKTIKIPDVCINMNINCINDFDFIREVNMVFKVTL
jgi:hypothetical protein